LQKHEEGREHSKETTKSNSKDLKILLNKFDEVISENKKLKNLLLKYIPEEDIIAEIDNSENEIIM
jgi:hypothetical protein